MICRKHPCSSDHAAVLACTIKLAKALNSTALVQQQIELSRTCRLINVRGLAEQVLKLWCGGEGVSCRFLRRKKSVEYRCFIVGYTGIHRVVGS